MTTRARHGQKLQALLATGLLACGASPLAAPPATVASAPAPPAAAETDHHHELHLPPVGATIRVTLDGKSVEVPVASLPHEGTSAPLLAVWEAAWPAEDPAPLHFDLTGSDGFHPAARQACAARLLTGAEVAHAHLDLASHDVGFDPSVALPGCYRVKAVVGINAVH